MVQLATKNSDLEINLQGAYVTSLNYARKEVLFSAQKLGEKLRGGVPVCAPVFGPGESVGLAQHGFARDIEWRIFSRNENEVKLTPVKNQSQVKMLPRAYQMMSMQLMIKLQEDTLTMCLGIKNDGSENIVVSPGFHPYFYTTDATNVTVQSDITRRFTAEQLLATQFLPPHQNKVSFMSQENVAVTIQSESLQQYAVWSANPDKYICVEPTMGGYLEHQPNPPVLQPGEFQTYDMTISWRKV